jgi:hypothetical protein
MEILGQTKDITFDVTNTGNHDVILGLPWLQKHNPHIDWETLLVTLPRSRYLTQAKRRLGALPGTKPSKRQRLTNIEVACYYLLKRQPDKIALKIPSEYKDFEELFQEELPEEALPPH